MTTYNTYQEAKIANPESEIHKTEMGSFITNENNLVLLPSTTKCNPADYCMTIEKFLADGHKFVDEDMYIGTNGRIVVIGEIISAKIANQKSANNNIRLVLRAAALNQTETPEEKEAFDVMAQDNEAEIKPSPKYNKDMYRKVLDEACEQFGCIPSYLNRNIANLLKQHKEYAQALSKSNSKLEQPKPKHTKEGYPRVTESIFELKGEFERGELYSNYVSDKGIGYDLVEDEESLTFNYCNNSLHRKVVTELTEREAFIERCEEILEENRPYTIKAVFGKIYDELVEGE